MEYIAIPPKGPKPTTRLGISSTALCHFPSSSASLPFILVASISCVFDSVVCISNVFATSSFNATALSMSAVLSTT